ncbi:5-oxoprolinase subunit C family protein [Spongiivirga citrea]|uniref:Allophanate hydrolase subunit 2 family protein n=1 Tax=Spongiivirga citrea TaxID=1481457 RepID=A0A6M0CKJ4_9FLAO|nr:biotin-dependent carboxyltransferase family protein [Spongiivirga citrea]NER16379.1 allophanate hydrolase subunit 2 family protein [Spongiivirga citrea]
MIKVLQAGTMSSFQDLGRFGYRHLGVPVSGAMDQQAMTLANALVGNNEAETVIEFALMPPKLRFEVDTTIAIAGTSFQPKINDNLVKSNKLLSIAAGDILSFKAASSGVYTYLSVSGGFKLDKVLGSCSYYPNIADDLQLKNETTIQLKQPHSHFLNARIRPQSNIDNAFLEVYKGPEFNLLSDKQQSLLLDTEFSISKTFNRMGIQLEEQIENELASILTSGVLPGTVQLTPSGKLIVLMRDAQTTGGYPRILQLTEGSINSISQKKFKDSIRFSLIPNPEFKNI